MAKYKVIMWKTCEQAVIVEAQNEDEASEKAFELWENDKTEVIDQDSQIYRI